MQRGSGEQNYLYINNNFSDVITTANCILIVEELLLEATFILHEAVSSELL